MGDFLDRVVEGEPVARQALSRQVEALAKGLSTLMQILAPQVVVLSGPITRVWQLVEPLLRSELDRHGASPEGVSMRRESSLEPMRTLAAAAIVLSRHHSYRMSA